MGAATHEAPLGAHDGVATVTSAIEHLWPLAEGRPEFSRRTGPRGQPTGARSFAVVPTLRNPRYLVPRSPQVAQALLPVQGGVKGLRMKALYLLQRATVLYRVPGAHVHVRAGRDGGGIETLLDAVTGDVNDVVVRLGRPRPNRTLVVWAFTREGKAAAIAKLSTGEVAHRAMEIEYEVLAATPAAHVAGLVAPEVLGYVRWHDTDVLVITPLRSPGARPSHDAPVSQMQALASSVGSTSVALRESALAGRLDRDVERLVPGDDRVWLRRALDDLLVAHGSTVVTTGAWHGDWVSWNMSLDDDQVLLWDWEHYEPAALAGLDHVHFLAQELRGHGTDVATEDWWLAEARAVLRTSWGMSRPQADAVLRAYLLEVNIRFVRDRQEELEPLVARDGWGRPLVERLSGSGEGPRTAQT